MKIKTVVMMALTVMAATAEWVPLWEGEAPGADRPAAGTETVGDGLRYGKIERPEYFLYRAPEAERTGQGVVILPGGGYTILAMDHEGHAYAKWLNQRGITAMVVKYRVSGDEEMGYGYPVPFLDARRAIRTMRAKAGEWGVDPGKIGVMGSSAGGHLASLCATRFGDEFEAEGGDPIDELSCRPDFAVLIYPVVSMGDYGHSGSRNRLIGQDPSDEMVARLSTDRQVIERTPPCFLITTSDDGVDCRNSLAFAMACKAEGVPVSLHLFEKGGHGYGLKGKGELGVWPELLDAWLKR